MPGDHGGPLEEVRGIVSTTRKCPTLQDGQGLSAGVDAAVIGGESSDASSGIGSGTCARERHPLPPKPGHIRS